jgi:hypothetical protein
MYDPTIFDNLKVVVEGAIYDLERDNRIRIRDRQDVIDLAKMGRTFCMSFQLPNHEDLYIEVELSSELVDFAAELATIRLLDRGLPGCQITIRYRFGNWTGNTTELADMFHMLQTSWSTEETDIRQTVETSYHATEASSNLTTTIRFLRKIDERNMGELESMLLYTLETAERLSGRDS